jgi:hypothetical protein
MLLESFWAIIPLLIFKCKNPVIIKGLMSIRFLDYQGKQVKILIWVRLINILVQRNSFYNILLKINLMTKTGQKLTLLKII